MDDRQRIKLMTQLAAAEVDLASAKDAQRRTNDPKTAAEKRAAAEKVAKLRNELRVG